MHMNPEAHFDCLLIASKLAMPLGGVTRLELHRIAFLSCLLSIYTKQAVSDWGYRFANTGTGLPFSDHLVEATNYLVATGLLSETESRVCPTELGIQMLGYLCGLQSMASRIPCVSAAAASLLAVPGSVMAEGLQQEPTTVASKLRNSPTMLLGEPHLLTLHQHFAALAAVIPLGHKDLLSPSVLWLTYMARVNDAQEEGGEDTSGPRGPGSPDGPGLPGGPSSPVGPDGEAVVAINTGSSPSNDQRDTTSAAVSTTPVSPGTVGCQPGPSQDASSDSDCAKEAQPS